MEVYTYLDNRKTTFRPQARLLKKRSYKAHKVNKTSFSQEHIFSTYITYEVHQKTKQLAESFGAYFDILFQKLTWYFRHRFFSVLFYTGIMTCAVIFSWSLISLKAYYSGLGSNVELEYLSPQEIEVLDKVMNDFALLQTDKVDAAGNLLVDGQALTIADINLSQPVTYSEYTIKNGDTISGISQKFGLTNISTLIAVNDIGNVRQIRAGQKLKIPSTDGLIHTVKQGDSIESLSVRYGTPVENILDVNNLDSVTLKEGQQLFIPGARLSVTDLKKAMGELFILPLSGRYRISSSFGNRQDPFTGVASFHTGVDLAIAQGTPIKAAMSGKVAAVGYTNVYGNYVIIDHENGYQTLYAHMYKPSPLSKGTRVAQGTQIGMVGSTGYSTGPHLHFTVYKNGKLIDPMTVLK